MSSQTLPAIWKTLEWLEEEEEEEHVLNIGLTQSQDGFPVSDPNYPISRASKPLNNAHKTVQGVNNLWGDKKMKN